MASLVVPPDWEKWMAWVNIDRNEILYYPEEENSEYPTLYQLYEAQHHVKKTLSELLLRKELTAFPESSIDPMRTSEPGSLARLPAEILLMILEELHPASLLTLASTNSFFYKLSKTRVNQILWPDHIGTWAGCRVAFVNAKHNRSREDFATETIARQHMKTFQSFHRINSKGGIYYMDNRMREDEITRQLNGILNNDHASIPYPVWKFVRSAVRKEEVYLPYGSSLTYGFIDHDSEHVLPLNYKRWLSTSIPDYLDLSGLPTDFFNLRMLANGAVGEIVPSDWAFRKVSVVPTGVDEEDGLEDEEYDDTAADTSDPSHRYVTNAVLARIIRSRNPQAVLQAATDAVQRRINQMVSSSPSNESEKGKEVPGGVSEDVRSSSDQTIDQNYLSPQGSSVVRSGDASGQLMQIMLRRNNGNVAKEDAVPRFREIEQLYNDLGIGKKHRLRQQLVEDSIYRRNRRSDIGGLRSAFKRAKLFRTMGIECHDLDEFWFNVLAFFVGLIIVALVYMKLVSA